MNIKKLKTNNGISMVDVMVAILILCMFVGVIGNLYYEILYQNNKIHLNAIAVYYTVKVAEEIDRISYEEVTNELNSILKDNFQIPDLINVTVDIQKYNSDDTSKQDIIKIITIRAEYQVLNETEIYEIKKLKIKES